MIQAQGHWLSRLDDIPLATEEDLLRAILTSDGMGKEFKEKCLEKLIAMRST